MWIPVFLLCAGAAFRAEGGENAPDAQTPPTGAPSPVPSPGLAGAPGPSPSPSPSPSPRPPGSAPTSPGASEEVRIRADSQGGEKGHYFFQGFADLHKGDIEILADRMDLYEIERPEGGEIRKLVAEGNVVFVRGEERLSGARATMDVDTGKGLFEDASGYIQPGVYIEAKIIERIDPDTYRIQGGKFTSCAQTKPRWGFKATSAKVEVNDKIIAKNAVFEVKDVPALYFPYFVYPITEDNRSTGFLIPHVGNSTLKGTNYGDAFFWAMGRSFDQTFYFDHYSLFDEGYGHEFRYALPGSSRGIFKTYALKPGTGKPWDWDINWSALQSLPLGIRATLVFRRYSNVLFQRQIQETLNLATTRTERASLSFQESIGPLNLQLLTDAVDTFFTAPSATDPAGTTTSLKNRHLPAFALTRSAQKIGSTHLVFALEAHADSLELGNQGGSKRYSRFDIAPTLMAPFAVSFLQVNPRAQVRYTHYGETIDPANGNFVDGLINRRYFEGSLGIVGPTFSRVFNNPTDFYSDKFKHTIGPEINWTYRTRVDNFQDIPKFDGLDQYLGTDQINYAIVQHFYAKRAASPGGKLQPYEFLTWRVGQTYYLQISENQNQFDPNYSASVFGPGGIPSHNSPLQSQLRIRPTPEISGTFNVEYDVNFRQLRSLSASAQAGGSLGLIQAGISKAESLAVTPAGRIPTLETLRGNATLNVIPRSLTLDGSAVYDFVNKNLIEVGGKLRYEIQCCGLLVEILRFDINGTTDRVVRFSIELANIGNVGTFFGQDPTKVYPGLTSYR
jgi:LPS-assembly protein